MNLKESNTLITFNTGANTTNFPDSQRIIFLNTSLDEVHADILSSEDGWDFDDKNGTDFPILTTDLVANQQDYSLPVNQTGSNDDIVRIQRVETKMSNRFYKAEPFDQGERGRSIAETTDLANDFVESAPKYDTLNGSILLYPIPTQDVTGGLKIWIQRSLANFVEADLSSASKFFGFDRQFHELIPLKVALSYMIVRKPNEGNKITSISNRIIVLTEKMKEWYGSKQEDREIVIKGAFVDYDTGRGNNNTNRRGPT